MYMGLKEEVEELKKLKGKKAEKKLDEILRKYADEIFASFLEEEDELPEEKHIFSEEHERRMEEIFRSLKERDE